VSRLQFCNEFLDLVKNNSDIVNKLLMSDVSGTWMHRTVANGLQTTHMNFSNGLCIVQKWQCVVKFILMALLVLICLRTRMAYSNAERYKVMLGTFLLIERHPRQQDLLRF